MLIRLTIQNYALIRHLEMTPSRKLTVITGETGAGKSIMLGAIGLLLGNRADTKVLWDESTKCITEGQFDISAYSLKPLFEDCYTMSFENYPVEIERVENAEIHPCGSK